jgi:hypothetical protein
MKLSATPNYVYRYKYCDKKLSTSMVIAAKEQDTNYVVLSKLKVRYSQFDKQSKVYIGDTIDLIPVKTTHLLRGQHL